ncbi:hypothetical protein vseg_012597 [Gypsophila vaccaria]
MKSRKKMKTSSNLPQISEFRLVPPDVWTRILATLPVKTLLRSRCVCKSWCSIIDSPDFVSIHLKLCSNNFDTNKVLALERLGRRRERSLLTVRRADTLRKTAHISLCCDSYYVSEICNGLLLVMRCDGHTIPDLQLWNPSIRKTLLLPPVPIPSSSNGEALKVFGFAPVSNDYKVIAISFERNGGIQPAGMSVAVYTLSDQQWTVRDNGLSISCEYFTHIFWYHDFPSPAFYFEGAGHWLGKHSDVCSTPDKPTHLVSLDLDTEKFTVLELPFAGDERKSSTYLFRLGESLAIFSISSINASIWVLQQGSGKLPWTLRFSGPSSYDGFKMFTYHRYLSVVYYESDSGICFIYDKKSYNVATCQVRQLGKSMSRFLDLQTYMESLVLCKGYGAEDMAVFQ